MTFELATASRIVVGSGVVQGVPAAVVSLGAKSVLVVTGRNSDRAAPLVASLRGTGLSVAIFSVGDEPSVDIVNTGVGCATDARADAVVAIGGGSALDTGKAIAALATNGGDPMEYLEVVGAGRPLTHAPLPFVAIPTTAGTGSEVTRNAVLSVPARRVKASLRSPLMLPALAVIDPDLLAAVPPHVIASSGVDALSQVIEPFLSNRANPITDTLARDGISRSARSLRRAYLHGVATDAGGEGQGEGQGQGQRDVRQDLALTSLCGGLCLANAGLGAVHGFAAPAGGMFHAPHGAVCAALLPHVLAVNLRALRARAAHSPALGRMHELAALLTGAEPSDVTPEDGITFVDDLCRALQIPGLARYGMSASDVPRLVEGAKAASSMKGNPLPLSDAELTEIAMRSL